MRIGILGTGIVGKTLGTRLAKLGNDVRTDGDFPR
jgi:predicted dinucleotide-binding enzyme